MAQTLEHKLGRAIVDEIAKLQHKLEVAADGAIAQNNNTNYMLTRRALLDAMFSADVPLLALVFMALLPSKLNVEKEVTA